MHRSVHCRTKHIMLSWVHDLCKVRGCSTCSLANRHNATRERGIESRASEVQLRDLRVSRLAPFLFQSRCCIFVREKNHKKARLLGSVWLPRPFSRLSIYFLVKQFAGRAAEETENRVSFELRAQHLASSQASRRGQLDNLSFMRCRGAGIEARISQRATFSCKAGRENTCDSRTKGSVQRTKGDRAETKGERNGEKKGSSVGRIDKARHLSTLSHLHCVTEQSTECWRTGAEQPPPRPATPCIAEAPNGPRLRTFSRIGTAERFVRNAAWQQ